MAVASFCNACGARFKGDDRFCANCGAGRLIRRVDVTGVGGDIAAAGLAEWWLTRPTHEQRQRFRELYQPFTIGGEPSKVDSGPWESLSRPSMTIGGLASSMERVDWQLALDLAEQALQASVGVQDRHFALSQLIPLYAGDYRTPRNAAKWEWSCREQVAIAPDVAVEMRDEFPGAPLPSHTGFAELVLSLRKTGDPEGELLAEVARTQGWRGPW